jgi:hypothetical protein
LPQNIREFTASVSATIATTILHFAGNFAANITAILSRSFLDIRCNIAAVFAAYLLKEFTASFDWLWDLHDLRSSTAATPLRCFTACPTFLGPGPLWSRPSDRTRGTT